jgi:hypothetical protein
MADNTFRTSRGRDPIAREDIDPTSRDIGDNPLADLARLIGQRDRNEFDRSARYDGSVQTLDHPAPAEGQDWAADERYAEPGAPQQYADDDYVEPRLPDYPPADPAYAEYDEREDAREPAPAARFAEPAHEQYDDPHDEGAFQRRHGDDRSYEDERSYAPPAPRYREEAAPQTRAVARQAAVPAPVAAPALAPQAHDDEYDEQWDEAGYDQSEAADEYEYEDDTVTPRRSRLAIVLALVGLILIGAAGAYAYRAMFGGAIMKPSLPPIIKPADGPNKIVPAPASGASNQAVNPGAPAQLVPREEQPVPVQPPPAPPKVLSQIPVPQAPSTPQSATPSAPPAVTAPSSAPVQAPGAPRMSAPQAPTSGEPKKVHTIAIPSDQVGNNGAAAPLPVAPAPAARPPRAAEPVTRTPPAPRGGANAGGANAPLSLVPGAPAPAAEPAAPRAHAVRAEPPQSAPMATAPAAPGGGGGYAVQVSSQRSEAEAQTAYRELQGRFPSQLAGHQPMIRRADLGDKGTFYRAMVGPFGSAEAAASLCSSLKAAGGSCIVQKN